MLKNSKVLMMLASNEYIEVYHGGTTIVDAPVIKHVGYPKDFGYGFYTTMSFNQAKNWAIHKGKGKGVVNKYLLHKAYVENNYLGFTDITDDWVYFIASCRCNIGHSYDIVEGPMADDEIWDYAEAYLRGSISHNAFKELCIFKHPTHQIVFASQYSIDRYLTYIGFEEVRAHG